MKAHLRYASYVLRHKWFVLVAGLKIGAPLWRLLIHDWSKFLPCEWFPYMRRFYAPPHQPPCNGITEDCSDCHAMRDAFDRAWLHHQHACPHHWQHWVLREDGGDTKVLEMPRMRARDLLELETDIRRRERLRSAARTARTTTRATSRRRAATAPADPAARLSRLWGWDDGQRALSRRETRPVRRWRWAFAKRVIDFIVNAVQTPLYECNQPGYCRRCAKRDFYLARPKCSGCEKRRP